jgi:Ca2+-binding RTX toxin-like protein
VPAGNSPAVDGGISSGLATDQRGVARPQDASALPNAADGSDIGAVELPVAACGPVSGLRIDGGPQADVLVGSEGVDPIFAGAGDDQADGLGEADCLFGEAGADGLVGGPGDDLLDGGEQRDLLNGGPGKDRLIGGADKDRLKGAAGKDRLKGGDAKDRLNGGSGKDRLKGGPGKDRLKAADGKRDRVNCGPGKRDRAVVDAKDKVSRSCEKVKLKSKRKRR